MHINRAPDPPPAKPCMQDMHELVYHHLPPGPVVKALPLDELARRLDELVADHPHLREEAPVALATETRRRQRYQGLRATQQATPSAGPLMA